MKPTPPALVGPRNKVSFDKKTAMWEGGCPQLLPNGDFACYENSQKDEKPGNSDYSSKGERASVLRKKNQSFDSVISVPLFLKNEADLLESDRNRSRDTLVASPFCSRFISRMSPSSLLSSPKKTWGEHERPRVPSFDLSEIPTNSRQLGSPSSLITEKSGVYLEQAASVKDVVGDHNGRDARGGRTRKQAARPRFTRAKPLRRGLQMDNAETITTTPRNRKRPRPLTATDITPKTSNSGAGSSPPLTAANPSAQQRPPHPTPDFYSHTHPHFIDRGRWESMQRKMRRSLRVGEWAFNCSSGELWWSSKSRKILGLVPWLRDRGTKSRCVYSFEKDLQQRPLSSFEEFTKRIPPADRKCVVSLFRRAISKGVPFDVSHRLVPLPKPRITVFGPELVGDDAATVAPQHASFLNGLSDDGARETGPDRNSCGRAAARLGGGERQKAPSSREDARNGREKRGKPMLMMMMKKGSEKAKSIPHAPAHNSRQRHGAGGAMESQPETCGGRMRRLTDETAAPTPSRPSPSSLKWCRLMCRVQFHSVTKRPEKLLGTVQDISSWARSIVSPRCDDYIGEDGNMYRPAPIAEGNEDHFVVDESKGCNLM
mmetsp:Transcript_7067/g.11167  ORF Transcript_7067/g.11167 Transcript_7067/m.11167 type:complete len:601 (+) Transcript_7067:152-1954(+)